MAKSAYSAICLLPFTMFLLRRYAVAASRIAVSFLVILLCKALYYLRPSKLRYVVSRCRPYLDLLNFCSSLQNKRSTIEGNLRRYYPDGDIEAKIRNDIRFFSSFHFLWAMVRTESKRFSENAEEGMLKSYSMKTWLCTVVPI